MENIRSLLFDFSGRINRARYWITVPIMLGIMIICGIGALMIGIGDGEWVFFNPFIIAAIVLIAWINIAVGIKRLHDRGKSGMWLMLFYAVPFLIGRIVDLVLGGESTEGFALNMVGFALGIWGFVEIACLKGTDGPNDYGADPLGATVLPPSLTR